MMRKTEPGKHYGLVTARCSACSRHCYGNSTAAGACASPSHEAIAAKAGCARSAVTVAIKALEEAGILTWVHCLTRIRERTVDLFDKWATRAGLLWIGVACVRNVSGGRRRQLMGWIFQRAAVPFLGHRHWRIPKAA